MTTNNRTREPIRHQLSPRIASASHHRSMDHSNKSHHQRLAQVSVVVTQPGKSVWDFEHPWSHTLCSCCTDSKRCCFAFFCPCCFEYTLFKRAGENCWACLCPGARFALRSKIRTAFRIEGDLIEDCCTSTCCPCCTAIQLIRELEYQGL